MLGAMRIATNLIFDAACLLALGLALGPANGVAAGEERPPRQETPLVEGTAAHGLRIYRAAGCASCHAATVAEDGGDPLRAAHPLEGAAYRGTWWNGRITTDAGDASDYCLRTFLDPNTEGFTAPERKALVLFMQSLGSERGVGPLLLLRRDAGDVDLRGAEPSRGGDLYRRACVSCHPGDGAVAAALIGKLSPLQVAEIVRKGTGRMPFFQVDRLTGGQVGDIASYLESLREATKP